MHIPWSDLKRALKGNILFLGIVSFFTDLSSEMIYPLLPIFFTGLVPPAVAAIYIGLMDGIAESTSSILKIYSGRWSDSLGKRKPLALGGYAISSIARPLMALAFAGWHVIFLRFLDRVGKGLRTSP
ncbi:MAG: MFS transporter, partial [bacterium]|nr:MFS transporter [bacterium]